MRDRATLARIKSLVIPPAWADVWISPHANGHMQATGHDARGRKQYRYHPKWREVRDETKYGRLIQFGYALPQIRERVDRDLSVAGLPRPKVLATVVQLLERTMIRVGNDEYARENNSFGLTTMRNRHVRLNGHEIKFAFRGKSGVAHEIGIRDRRLAAIVKRCRDLPGQELFQYEDDEGKLCDVESNDVNEYLRGITGESFTSKDFRTWAGTVLAAEALRLCGPCRKCYVHPAVLAAFEGGQLARAFGRRAGRGSRAPARLGESEVAVLRLLERSSAKQPAL